MLGQPGQPFVIKIPILLSCSGILTHSMTHLNAYVTTYTKRQETRWLSVMWSTDKLWTSGSSFRRQRPKWTLQVRLTCLFIVLASSLCLWPSSPAVCRPLQDTRSLHSAPHPSVCLESTMLFAQFPEHIGVGLRLYFELVLGSFQITEPSPLVYLFI